MSRRTARYRKWSARRVLRSRSIGSSKKYKLGSLAYYYKGVGIPDNEDALSSIIVGNSLLTGRGVPVAGRT